MPRHSMTKHTRVLLASLTGTTVEFYDFYIYATAASLVFGPLFFPTADKAVQLLSSYAVFGVAFIARPVGAALFGTAAVATAYRVVGRLGEAERRNPAPRRRPTA